MVSSLLKMFCFSCGGECPSTANFCRQCGQQLAVEQDSKKDVLSAVDDNAAGSSCRSGNGSASATLTFSQFKARKEEDRRGYFRRKRPAKRPKLVHQPDNSDVKINVGIMALKDGALTIKRGITLPLTVPHSIGADELLEKAVEKHFRFNKDVVTSSNTAFYHLLYGDKNLVSSLPGSEEPFTLKRYKDEIDKPYSRITLYLCSSSDYNDSIFCELDSDIDLELCDVTPGFTPTGVEDKIQNTGSRSLPSSVPSCSSHSPSISSRIEQQGGLVGDTSNLPVGSSSSSTVEVLQLGDSLHPSTSTSLAADAARSSSVGAEPLTLGTTCQVEMQEIGTGPTLQVTIHRALLKNDMLQVFKDPEILHYSLDITVIAHNGREEEGKGQGVIKEVLTTFWNECFSSLTVGAVEKVPCVRHDYQRSEWEALGRVIVYGYFVAKYFPIGLCRAFVCTMLFGEESLTPEFLIQSFKLYISVEDQKIVDKSLGADFDPSDDDLLDFLSSLKCYKCPTEENIKCLMYELAHQEIVQKPRYIMDCLAPIVSALRVFPSFQTLKDLEEFYGAKKPSAKKVIKLLSANPTTTPEQSSLDFFKKYVRNLDGGELSTLLQFLTGSNIITCDTIEITFTTLQGTGRRPIVHTCGPSLELPSTFLCYNELAEEFAALLQDKESWSFNIV